MQTTTMGALVVGVDGSSNAADALGHAAELALATGAEVVAVHAVGLLAVLHPGDEPVPAEGVHDEIRRLFEEEWCAPLREARVKYRAELTAGEAVGALGRAAAEVGASMIVIGMRGHNRYGLGVLGSTTLQLLAEVRCPVLVVPPAAER
jgi:nucleotide-binding universal stress UspA family protein